MSAPTFEGQPMTKREVLIAREAVGAAIKDVWHMLKGSICWGEGNWRGSDAVAERLYPLPKVTRPRVVCDGDGDEWRWTPEHGLQIRDSGAFGMRNEGWDDAEGWQAAPDGVRVVLADLLANPTEEVDA